MGLRAAPDALVLTSGPLGTLRWLSLATTVAAVGLNVAVPSVRPVATIVEVTSLIVAVSGLSMIRVREGAAINSLLTAVALIVLGVLTPIVNHAVPFLLAVVLALHAAGSYGVGGGATVALCALGIPVVCLLIEHPHPPPSAQPWDFAGPLALVGVLFAFLIGLTSIARAESRSRMHLEIANSRLAQHAERAEEIATLRERSRIAFELHDAVGHALTTAIVQVQSARRLRAGDPIAADVFTQRVEESLSELLAQTRAIVAELRSDPLDGYEFSTCLERLAVAFAHANELALICEIESATVAKGTAIEIVRVVQEALTNIARHAAATSIRVTLSRDDVRERIAFLVEDNGRGFRAQDTRSGQGLAIMRERIVSLGGQLDITSGPSRGCRVAAWVPASLSV